MRLRFHGSGVAAACRHPWGYVMTLSDTSDINEAGRALGHDLCTQSFLPRQASWPSPVAEGFDAAVHAGLRRRQADRFTGKWLQLRCSAFKRGRIVSPDVTPALIEAIDTAHCPVLRTPLTHGTLQDSDWSVDRLNNDAAYAASNLAVMSVKANQAKGTLRFEDVHERAQQAQCVDGLSPMAWLRLAVLMLGPAYAQRPDGAPLLPLCAPLPCRVVRLAPQQIQRLLTENCARHAGKNQMIRAFAPACANDSARMRLDVLGHAVHDGLKHTSPHDERWDVWLQPSVMAAFEGWMASLDAMSLRRAAEIAGRLSEARCETPERLRAWHLPTRGYVQRAASY